jgi:GTP cyclohydrolase I
MYRDYALGDVPGVRICPGIHFVSMCEHHFAPFYGTVDIAYMPGNGKVTGLSKLPQLVQKYARRPQLQERMVSQIADELIERCEATGVLVIGQGYHTCEMIEGVKEGFHRDKPYITPEIRGCFATDASLRDATIAHLGRSSQ